MANKILVVFTGGTIGSTSDNGIVDVSGGMKYKLIDLFYRQSDFDVQFDAVQPINMLSENFSPDTWTVLANCLAEHDLSRYKGVIITHGSDTLPYTAAVFSYILKNIALPVVFVAANKSIDHPNSNGIQNFTDAVRFILTSGLCGVYSIYMDDSGNRNVYYGTRMHEADTHYDRFSSYAGVDFGKMVGENFVYNSNPLNPKPDEIIAAGTLLAVTPIKFNADILCIRPYPGLRYDVYDLKKISRPAAVLHGLYHSSTACTVDENRSVVNFIKRCTAEGIDVYLYDCKHFSDDSVYRSADYIKSIEANCLSGISFEATAAKLYVAYSQSDMPPREYMNTNINFEFVNA